MNLSTAVIVSEILDKKNHNILFPSPKMYLFIEFICQGSRRGLIEDTENFQPGKGARVSDNLSLHVTA